VAEAEDLRNFLSGREAGRPFSVLADVITN
jgi:hypothetical protein